VTHDALVSVAVVTYNSARVIATCLHSIRAQTYRRLEVLIIDNASTDATLRVIEDTGLSLRLLENKTNLGFAGAHNQAIRLSQGAYYLALNPDVIMAKDFVERLVSGALLNPRVGSVSGKLVRAEPREGAALLDSTGIYMTPALRHLDRGSGESDQGQYECRQYVFGASGAAALYRRAMLDDIAFDGQYFDEDYFAYREDADLAWRAQLRGWRCLYTPDAIARHERRVVPERRRELPEVINRHSVKNRFLLHINNLSFLEFLALFVPIVFRNICVIGYVDLVERSSLSGLWFIVQNLARLLRKRRVILSRRTASRRELLEWFRYRPVAFELEPS
jgi:GT2 family glycosyltransferase